MVYNTTLDKKVEGQLGKIMVLIREWVMQKKVGSIQVNLYQGGISNINLKESVKIEEK